LIEGSSATDAVTDVTDVTDVRKKEEGINFSSQVIPGNAFHFCCASSFLRAGRASRNSFFGTAKERDNESRNERFLRAGRARVKFIPWQSQGTRKTGK
jgi:hypothetical protein